MVGQGKPDDEKAVWTSEELHREEVRGVFVLGVIAILFGFYQNDAVKAIFSSGSAFAGVLVNLVTLYLVVFWGLYVVCTAMSFERWKARKRELQVLLALKSLASLFFNFGATMTLVIVVLLGPLVIIDSLGKNSYATFVFLAGLGVLVGTFILLKWSRRLRSFVESLRHRGPKRAEPPA